jgi:glutamine---fructose-6-phosphate transaminase (isomerizing)
LLADRPEPRVLAERLAGAERLFVVARGLLQAAALEAALKIKETARIVAEGISTADFRHGPIAAVDRDVPVLAFEHSGPAAQDVRELVAELETRGARVARLAVGDAVPEALAVIPAVVRAQQLALELALARGLDPDAPAGLSKITATH